MGVLGSKRGKRRRVLKQAMTEEYLLKAVFDEHKESLYRRLDEYNAEIGKVRAAIHGVAEKVAPLTMLPSRVEEIVDDLKNVPRREEIQKDLEHVTITLTTKFDLAEKARLERDAQKWRTIQLMFWVLGGISTILGVISVIKSLSQHVPK